DADDVDQLVELLEHLLERCRIGVDDHRDAREALVGGGRDRQREDVEPAPADQADDARQHVRLVLHRQGEEVMPCRPGRGLRRRGDGHRGRPSWLGWTTMSSLDAPAGTIGKTCSIESVRKSTTTGRSSIEFAFSITGTTSS